MRHSQRWSLAGVAACLLAGTVALSAAAAGKPGVSFLPPKVSGSTVTATVKLVSFTLDPKDVGKRSIPGKGHLHFQLDGGKFDYPKYSGPNGQLAAKLGIAGKYSPSVTPTITYRHLPSGKHVLRVFLANNDHSPAGAQASVAFTVRK